MAEPSLPEETLMFREASEAADAVRRQRARNADVVSALGERLRRERPRAVVTLARGSSDHAATFARYLVERRAGVLSSSMSPSIASLYDSTPDLTACLVLAISQSGRSPDLIAAAERARVSGGLLVTMVNQEGSPLADLADVAIPLEAGPERSVAASKSFIASLAAILDLLAAWTGDAALQSALTTLPDKLDEAWSLDWSAALPLLASAQSFYIVGRGHGFGSAQEAALKLKETCGIHAEAFSAAELRHGPMALAGPGFPVLLFGQPDESLPGVTELAADLVAQGVPLITAGVPGGQGLALPVIDADPLIAPVLEITSFYRLANALSLARGRDPDRPPHLRKVTETL